MEISTFQDAGYNLNEAQTWHTVNSARIMYELNWFTGSLTYSIGKGVGRKFSRAEPTEKRPKISKKCRKIALFSLFQGGEGGNGKKRPKNSKKRPKNCTFKPPSTYLHHV